MFFKNCKCTPYHIFVVVFNLYRKKKHSTVCNSAYGLDKNASNYVAKSYIENVDGSVYFEDVKLQMDAKIWGEEYNRHNPPKKASFSCSRM